jgi:CheY-like chemotaxis protein
MKAKSVLIVEDDPYYRNDICTKLKDRGINTFEASSGVDALKQMALHAPEISVAVIDVNFIWKRTSKEQQIETHGKSAGLRLARHIREKHPHVRLIGMSGFAVQDVREWFAEHGQGFLRKHLLTDGGAKEFIDKIERVARKRYVKPQPQTFIVHGHDNEAVHDLASFIEQSLRWPRPKILRELPSEGRTLIEKFEDAAQAVDVVFVLLTPDDKAAPAKSPNTIKRRARQNVIFELGYFYAKLQRQGGRVVLLHKGDIELPSDLAGIVYADIKHGIDAAGETIRRELSAWI